MLPIPLNPVQRSARGFSGKPPRPVPPPPRISTLWTPNPAPPSRGALPGVIAILAALFADALLSTSVIYPYINSASQHPCWLFL